MRTRKRFRGVLRGVASVGIGLILWGAANGADRQPNILWITAEDMSPVLGCYGDRCAVTPTLNRLAEEGVRYTNAFAVASVCAPARSGLITGVYPTSLGTQHLRSVLPIPNEIRCFPEYLREAGYYCTNNVKEDYNFRTPAGCWDESSREAHWRNRKPGQPFFAVFNFMTTHQSRIRFSEEQFGQLTARLKPHERHDPAEIALPPYYPDTPVVRRDVARFYDLVTAMDQQVGDILAQLEEDGLADQTIVFFYSDHGTGLPRHKRWLYDSGLRVPLIIRFAEKFRHLAPAGPGSAVDRLVSFVDFAPTVLSLTGVKIPGSMEGRPFLGREAAEPRRYVFAVRDRVDEVYEMSRAVGDGRWKYIRHFMPHRPVMPLSDFSERTPLRQELRRLAAEGRLTRPPKALMSPRKPAEELFDTQNDPHEIHNLADSPEHWKVLERMRRVLHRWMLATHDTGLLAEGEMYLRAGGRPPYEVVRQPGYPEKRILEAAELVGRGASALPKLMKALADADGAVRYWGAVGLCALGPEGRPAEEALAGALADPAPSVRIAAAEALSNQGRAAEALPVLVAGLEHENEWVRLQAGIALQYIGRRAQPALPQIQKVLARQDKGEAAMYLRWGLGHVLEGLEH